MRTLSGCFVLALAVCSLAGGSVANAAENYKSPQAVFDAAVEAAKKKDWKAFYGCLTTESAEQLTGGMTVLALFARGFADLDKTGKAKEKIKPLQDVLNKHGLTNEKLEEMKKAAPKKPATDPKEQGKALRALVEPVKDKAEFLAGLMKALEEINPKKSNTSPLVDGKLKDLKVTGDKATGVLVRKVDGKDKEEPLTFVKGADGWKIELPEPKAPAAKK